MVRGGRKEIKMDLNHVGGELEPGMGNNPLQLVLSVVLGFLIKETVNSIVGIAESPTRAKR